MTIGETVAADFSDLTTTSMVQLLVRLVVAGVVGGILGWQREATGKAAGFRTHILVALGCAAFIVIPHQAGLPPDGISRILQGLIAGIGFIGAGCIIKQEANNQIKGMTTAAGIWLTAAVGIAAGMGRESSAIILGLIGWFTLSGLHRWERWIAKNPTRSNQA